MRRGLIVLIAAAVLCGAGLVWLASGEPTETFCTAEGFIGPENKSYGRSSDHGCQFVDDEGELITELRDGTPICYDEHAAIVSCAEPGARPPG